VADLTTRTYDEFREESDRRMRALTTAVGTIRYPEARAQVTEVLEEWRRRLADLTWDQFRKESDRRMLALTNSVGTIRFPAARAQVEEVLIEWDRRLNVGAARIYTALDEDQASLDRIRENTLAAIREEEQG